MNEELPENIEPLKNIIHIANKPIIHPIIPIVSLLIDTAGCPGKTARPGSLIRLKIGCMTRLFSSRACGKNRDVAD